MTEPRKGWSLVDHTVADYEHVGRVLAARLRVGPGHLFDVRERAKARRKFRSMTLYERVQSIRGRS